MSKGIVYCVLGLSLIGLCSVAQGDAYALAVRASVDDCLYRVNLTTGSAVKIGAVGYDDIEGLSWQPGTGVLFGVDDVSENLITINTVTGAGSTVGALMPGSSNYFADMGLAFSPDGSLYMATNTPGKFYSVNSATGQATAVGNQGQLIDGLACSRSGVMYGMSSDGTNLLTTINVATGVASTIGPLVNVTVNSGGLDFGPDGVLWGIEHNGKVFTLNTATGEATVVSTTLAGFKSLVIIPEPMTISLMLMGGLTALRRKR